MSAVTALAGAAVSGVWKATIIFLAAGDRDLARAALVSEQGVSAGLRASIAEQNLVVDGIAKATLAVQQRGEAAQAAAAGRKYGAAQAQLVGMRATTCDDAMPAVRAMLEGAR